MSEHPLPSEIVEAFYPYGITDHSAVPGGEVNVTYLVADASHHKTILQKLSPVYDERVGRDYEVVAAHLRNKGWEMAETLGTASGDTWQRDNNGNLWRAFHYIDSAPGREFEGNLTASTALGGLLGTLHRDLADLHYEPTFARTDTQGGDNLPAHLHEVMPQIADSEYHQLAAEMLTRTNDETITPEPVQVIHADPRIGNTLFHSRIPFTFIDWDGFKQASIFVDVGDMVQSTIGEVLTKGSGHCSATDLYPALHAYYAARELQIEKMIFMSQALAAARVIALDLGMRHLIDSVEDSYFVWDKSRFPTRQAFNFFCAQRQWDIYQVLKSPQVPVQ